MEKQVVNPADGLFWVDSLKFDSADLGSSLSARIFAMFLLGAAV